MTSPCSRGGRPVPLAEQPSTIREVELSALDKLEKCGTSAQFSRCKTVTQLVYDRFPSSVCFRRHMTIDQEKVSVIIPVLNSVECLPTGLGSVIAAMKDYGNAELIL